MFHNFIIRSCQWNNKGVMNHEAEQCNSGLCKIWKSWIWDYKKIAIIDNGDDDDPTQTIIIIGKFDHRPFQQSCIFVCSTPTQHNDVVAVKIEDIYGPCVLCLCV